MTIVYGGTIEPGGYELSDERFYDECPRCRGQRCSHRYFESAAGGSINPYHSIVCEDCGYRDDDMPEGYDDDFEADEAWDDPCDG